MRLSAQIQYDADPTRVFAMLSDPAFQEAKCVATGAKEHEVEVSVHANGSATLVSRRLMPPDFLPDSVRALVGSRLRLVETQQWQPPDAGGGRTGTVEVLLEGIPVRFTGSIALARTGSGTMEPIEGDLVASVPLFGGRIEKATEPAVLAAIRVEQRAGTQWLNTHPE